MGTVEPPQPKRRLPQYARDKLVEPQEKFDHLEQLGVFQRPEDVPCKEAERRFSSSHCLR